MKIAVIGAGRWGRNVIRTLSELDALGAIVETDSTALAQLAHEYPGVSLYEDYRSLLRNSTYPAVAIATPAHSHYQIAKECLLADKDVFVEKPLTLLTKEAEELFDLAESRHRILMVGHLLLYQPAIQKIKEIIDSGELGKLYSLHQERLNLGRARSVENALWSLGVHDVAVLLYLVGEEPTTIQSFGHAGIQKMIEDDVYLHLGFPSGVQANLHVSWLWPEKRRQLVVVGSKGIIAYDELEQVVLLHKKGIREDLTNRDEGTEVLFEGAQEPLRLEMEHFLDCIAERQPPRSDGRSGINVVRVLECAMRFSQGHSTHLKLLV